MSVLKLSIFLTPCFIAIIFYLNFGTPCAYIDGMSAREYYKPAKEGQAYLRQIRYALKSVFGHTDDLTTITDNKDGRTLLERIKAGESVSIEDKTFGIDIVPYGNVYVWIK